MIIESQDKDKIVNFDNLTQIYITQDEEEKSYFIRYETVDSLYDDLGEYKTEERAKEVLQEIIDTYTRKILINNNTKQQPILDDLVYRVPIDSNIQYIDTNIVYEMPKE